MDSKPIPESQPIILLGASVRAAAMSALRAGWTPWCADLFSDADLMRVAPVRKVPLAEYPRGLIDALADAPQAPVIYGGALENRPDLVGRIDGPLWGNSPDVLRAIRTPGLWTRCLQAVGLPCPALAAAPPNSGRWLLKPRKSAGGIGILPYAGEAFNPRTHYLQECIDGQSVSAVFLGKGDSAILLGVTQQLIGTAWLNASGFHYAGSIGPLPLEPATAAHWRALGQALASAFHLRGLFGVDAILRDGVPWPVEINPRYTASLEILERSAKIPLLLWHRAAFEHNPAIRIATPPTMAIWGKAVLYARATIAFPSRGPWDAALAEGVDFDETQYADIPHAGEIIERGRPVLTLFALGESVCECLTKLREKAEALDRRLWG
jgi:predicted ATP-grasp superfamily ATP-dependent carboligase